MARKFYKAIYEIVVLSEEAPDDEFDLGTLNYDVTQGHCSGQLKCTEVEIVDGPTIAQLLQSQGSDPEFFRLDSDGNDLDQDEDQEE